MTQENALTLMKMGHSVFLTGAPGSGKTHTLLSFIQWMKEKKIPHAITASTGIAASHIQGQTIHSWSGIGIRDTLSPYEIDALQQKEPLVKRIMRAEVLIIDEISMLGGKTLDTVDILLRAVRSNEEPFGGMQTIFCGDFFQLPPIMRRGEEIIFAFHSQGWREKNLLVCYLSEQHRHKEDMLHTILNHIRKGDDPHLFHFHIEEKLHKKEDESIPHLYTHNVDVDTLNTQRLEKLSGKKYRYEMKTKGAKKWIDFLEKSVRAPKELFLKEGAVVMFVKNHPKGLYVNGTLGIIESFKGGFPFVKTYSGDSFLVEEDVWTLEDEGAQKIKAEIEQIPLRLAWAVTVHKSQGMTLDAASIDLSKTFVAGQGYVALSRLRSFSGLYLKGITFSAYERNQTVGDADEYFRKESERAFRRLEKTEKERVKELIEKNIQKKGREDQKSEKKEKTEEKTFFLLKKRYTVSDIAEKRGIKKTSVMGHLEKLSLEGVLTLDDIMHLSPHSSFLEKCSEVADVFKKTKGWNLTPVKDIVGEKYTYEELKLFRLFLRTGGRKEEGKPLKK
jgi:ATP-dependent exoDNAse (exonuclease V) alpha subunit